MFVCQYSLFISPYTLVLPKDFVALIIVCTLINYNVTFNYFFVFTP